MRVLPRRSTAGAVHAFAVERHRDVAAAVDRDQSAVAAQARHIRQRRRGRPGERFLAVAHARRDVVGHRCANERFAKPGPGNRAGAIVGIGSGADDRRIADAPRQLAGIAAGRGRGGEIAFLVERHRADRAVMILQVPRQRRAAQSRVEIRLATRSFNPCRRANASAPLPASNTCRLFSITARAASTGLRMRRTAATAPARSRSPSITEASISISPSALKHEPRPALKSGESSSTITAGDHRVEGGFLLITGFQGLLQNRAMPLARLVAAHDARAAVDGEDRLQSPRYAWRTRSLCSSSLPAPLMHDAAVLQHVGAVRDLERHRDVLLDQQDGEAALVEQADGVQHLLHHQRREAERGLVEHDELGRAHQAAADGEHLLLAAGHGAGELVRALGEPAGTWRTRPRSVRFCAPARARGSIAPISRFSSTVRLGNTWRPSATWPMPRLQICVGLQAGDVLALEKRSCPRAAARCRRCVRMSEDLPAPLAPTMATISPCADLERDVGERLRVAVVEIEVLDREHQTFGLLAEVALEHRRVAHHLLGRAARDDLAVVQHADVLARAPSPRASRARSAGWSGPRCG